jgi:hypothetical protein
VFERGRGRKKKRLEIKKEKNSSHLAGDPALDREAGRGLHRGLVREAQVGERGPARDPDLRLDKVDALNFLFFF